MWSDSDRLVGERMWSRGRWAGVARGALQGGGQGVAILAPGSGRGGGKAQGVVITGWRVEAGWERPQRGGEAKGGQVAGSRGHSARCLKHRSLGQSVPFPRLPH